MAGPAAVVSRRARRPAIHTSVVSTNTDGMPKYTRNPAAGTRRPACLVASACPNSWQASASTLKPSRTAAPSAYDRPVRKTGWLPSAQVQTKTANPASAARPSRTAATRVNSSRPPAL
ncbi:MAG: hypothetical protein AUI10_08745 [Actinobacteria bacterium 13_2_20CM_2_72_6]|nr:MAG: hypothetical protein AUI10_08745 [Actinobacteria bacterium 13_2_20CM_2_72_6]